ncbi:MAG: hypothetical protein ACI3U8_02130 [Candidatus Onthomonas sp.]
MIEKTVQDYLNDTLEVSAYLERPADRPERYVLVCKTGGSERNHISYGTVALQSYAPSKYEAAVLNEQVKAAMRGIAALPQVSRAELNRDYDYTDTTRKEYRYQAVYDLVVME